MGFVQLIPLIILLVLFFLRSGELINSKEKWFDIEPTEDGKTEESRISFCKREFQDLSSEESIRRESNDKLVN